MSQRKTADVDLQVATLPHWSLSGIWICLRNLGLDSLTVHIENYSNSRKRTAEWLSNGKTSRGLGRYHDFADLFCSLTSRPTKFLPQIGSIREISAIPNGISLRLKSTKTFSDQRERFRCSCNIVTEHWTIVRRIEQWKKLQPFASKSNYWIKLWRSSCSPDTNTWGIVSALHIRSGASLALLACPGCWDSIRSSSHKKAGPMQSNERLHRIHATRRTENCSLSLSINQTFLFQLFQELLT